MQKKERKRVRTLTSEETMYENILVPLAYLLLKEKFCLNNFINMTLNCDEVNQQK